MNNQQLMPVQDLTISYEGEVKWDLQLLNCLNENTMMVDKKIKSSSNDFRTYTLQLQKYTKLNDIGVYISYDNTNNRLTYNDNKLQIYKIDKSTQKTQYMFGFKTMSKPRLCYTWGMAQLKLCRSAFGDFHVINMANEASIIHIMERIMGEYMFKQNRQPEPDPLSIEEGAMIPVPKEKDLVARSKFLSKFFVLNTEDNIHNIETNTIDEPFMLSPMSLDMYNSLFEIADDKKVSNDAEFIVCTVFNGVNEKTKFLPSKEMQYSFSLWLTPLVYIYVNKTNK
ncbi:single-stranded DNA binding protein [Erinnyis ello granulovirus]|uniref:Single-stranded DNA binding protein n=1 Tax=Erinnyis ello granulovirus TaxID=307444 RepID=A0A097DAQ5_9BBAC|nr:single-stranded DNA binding protein [Erinnyis ello granulovirus]AIS92072.1 single-stranded DNA binding protein [Erinnyis ello granulovirus]ARX71412.1 single-stranded DNA binding protein [Erinnyis ello granulovirus]ARX71542.1 single-stranded DNA binding protein [Erinnyis ello granulovirus]ARX71672.1 single-stranded DNA binding protein [Erinnyis ello granulovirus]ARX71802.1 single-stranded DNA binding protein [Erinnyis ello granulovirus]